MCYLFILIVFLFLNGIQFYHFVWGLRSNGILIAYHNVFSKTNHHVSNCIKINCKNLNGI